MGIRVEYEPCTYCSETGLCPTCLGDGRVLSNGEFVDCTACFSQVEGGCMYCGAEGKHRHVYSTEEDEIELDFTESLDEDFDVSL